MAKKENTQRFSSEPVSEEVVDKAAEMDSKAPQDEDGQPLTDATGRPADGVVSREPIGNGLVRITGMHGEVAIEREDGSMPRVDEYEDRQAVTDAAVENSRNGKMDARHSEMSDENNGRPEGL